MRAEAELLLGDVDWIGGSWAGAIEHLEKALAAEPDDPALAARAYPKLVNYSTHDPKEIERAERAVAALSSQRVPAAVASVSFDLYWTELLLGHGARRELFKRWEKLEDQAGPDAPKSVIPLIYFHSIDDFDAARRRHAVEAEWYRVRGEEGGGGASGASWVRRVPRRTVGPGRAARRGGLCSNCSARAPGPVDDTLPLRSIVDAGRGRTRRARTTLLPLIDEANRFGGRSGSRCSSRPSRSWNSLMTTTLRWTRR